MGHNVDGKFQKLLHSPRRSSETSELKTDWSSMRIVSAIIFLGTIQMSVIGMSEWPYMKQIDPLATTTFFGYVGSASSLGHAIFAPLMGYWSSATGQTKLPFVVGRLIAMVGCILYVCLELFPYGRRYVMLICYTIFGISLGSVSIMRGYVAKISTVEDRAMSISLLGLALMLAVAVGPLFQLMFTSLSYPGYNIIGHKFMLNIYTGPIYVAICANLLSLIFIMFFFKEKLSIHQPIPQNALDRKSSRAVAALTTDMRAFDLLLALSCIVVRMIATLTISVIHTTTSPLMMSAFGWSNLKTVKISSFMQTITGTLSIVIFVGFASGKFTKIISERFGALIAILLFGLFFILTYPWNFLGDTIPIKNATQNASGCETSAYEWCLSSHTVSPTVYIASTITVLGVAFTLVTITVDTLYSKILGNIDQGTMQGVFLFCQDIINICGPVIIAPAFTISGQKYIWMTVGILIAIVCFQWIAVYKRLPKSEAIIGKWFNQRCKQAQSWWNKTH